MVRQYKKRRPFKYSMKQMTYWKNKSKKEKAIKKWNIKIESLKRQIRKQLENESIEDDKRKKILLWTKQQEIQISKDAYNKIKVEQLKGQQTKRMNKLLKESKSIMSYLKKESIASTQKNYQQLVDNTKGAYDSLLNDALKNPKDFKELIIGQMDKLKHLLEIEMIFIAYDNKRMMEQAKIIVRNHTLEDILIRLKESGINLGEIMDSMKFKDFRNRLAQSNGMFQNVDGTLVNIDFKISLRRGKV